MTDVDLKIEKEEQAVAKSIRAVPAVFEKIKAIQEETGFTQDGALKALIEAYEFKQAKEIIPDRATEIANFQAKAKELTDAFINSLQLNLDAETRIRSEFETQLKTMEKALADTQEKNSALKNQNVELSESKKQLDEVIKEKESLQKKVDELEHNQELDEIKHEKQLADKDNINVMLTEKLAVAEKQAEGYLALQAEKDELQGEIQALKQDLKDKQVEYNRALKDLQHSHEMELEKAARSADEAVQTAKNDASEAFRRAELAHSEALNNLRAELSEKAEKAQNELLEVLKQHSEEIKGYEKEINRLNQTIAELRAVRKGEKDD